MKTLVAVAQMTTTNNKEENLQAIESLVVKASFLGAKFLSLPENFAFMGGAAATAEASEGLDGQTILRISALAKKYGIWLSLGGFQEKIPGQKKIHNTHVLLDDQGVFKARYRKIHVFSVTLPDGSIYEEDLSVQAGDEVVSIPTPFFIAGLSICYDLRFAHLFWELRAQGAEVLVIPAAFTDTSGKAHWEVLLRARAIETQSYVMAAAQVGKHSPDRVTHGHAMIVDPWGVVIAQCGAANTIAVAEIDTTYVAKLRRDMPLAKQRFVLR